MKHFYPILFTMLSGCAMGDDIHCFFVTNELCVDPQGYYIDTQMVYDTVNITEAAVNKFYPGLNLPDLIKKHDVKVKYISKKDMIKNHNPDARGIYYREGHAIYIAYPDSWKSKRGLCMENYYVLSHELEHFIFEEYLDGSDKDGYNHNTDLFLIWVFREEGRQVSSSAEYYAYTDIDDICQELDK